MKHTYHTKSLALMVIALLAVACGKDNQSGKKTYSNLYGTNVGVPNLSSGVSSAIVNNIRCSTGSQQRVPMRVNVPNNVGTNSVFVGVAPEGDVAFLSTSGGQAVLTVYMCARPGLTGQGNVSLGPIVGPSQAGCPFNDLVTTVVASPYVLAFSPVQYYGYSRALGCRL